VNPNKWLSGCGSVTHQSLEAFAVAKAASEHSLRGGARKSKANWGPRLTPQETHSQRVPVEGGGLHTVQKSHKCTQATLSPKNLSIPGHAVHTYLGIMCAGTMESLVALVEHSFILAVFGVPPDWSSLVIAVFGAT
jgi:hypothetical protein